MRLLLLFVVGLLLHTVAARRLLQLQLVHRHGARLEPLRLPDGSLTWNYATLTPAGAAMGRNLGKYLRATYGDVLGIPASYSRQFIRSNSTDYSRTVQTAAAVLSGLFDFPNGSMPWVYHVPTAVDYALNFNDNYPNHIIRDATVFHPFWDRNDIARSLLGSNATVLISGIGDWCASRLMECSLFAEDVAQCRRANGGVEQWLDDLFPTLLHILALQNVLEFGYNASSQYGPVGSYGAPLLAEWVANIANAGNGSFPTIYHYSAHDNTVIGVLVALGVLPLQSTNWSRWVPRFTETIILEVYDDGSVQFLIGKPTETAGSGFVFSFQPLPVACGATLSSSCSFQELEALLKSTSPQVSNAPCFLTPADAANCSMTAGALPSGSACEQYRALCPMEACTAMPSVLDIAHGFACLPFPTKQLFSAHAGIYIVLTLVAFGAALFIGVGIDEALHRLRPTPFHVTKEPHLQDDPSSYRPNEDAEEED